MSKPYSGSPSLSRSGSPPLLRSASSSSIYSNHAERRTDDEKTMANLGGAPRPASPTREKEQAPHPPSSREQILPILNYCAASIMMTVVNKVSTVAAWPRTVAAFSRSTGAREADVTAGRPDETKDCCAPVTSGAFGVSSGRAIAGPDRDAHTCHPSVARCPPPPPHASPCPMRSLTPSAVRRLGRQLHDDVPASLHPVGRVRAGRRNREASRSHHL